MDGDSRGRCKMLELPDELLERTLDFLPVRDMLAATETCRALKAVFDGSPALKYRTDLSIAGYIDIPNRPPSPPASEHPTLPASALATAIKSPHTGRARLCIPSVSLAPWPRTPPSTRADHGALSTAEKDAALRAQQRRWEHLAPAQVRTISAQDEARIYELQEGVMLLCQGPERGAQDHRERPRKVRLIPLPSVNDPDLDDPIVPCNEKTLPFPIGDLTMDPTQDLLVVSEFIPPSFGFGALGSVASTTRQPVHRIHFLTLSTFEPHPLAARPTVDFPPVERNLATEQLIQVMHDTVVVLVATLDLLPPSRLIAHEEVVAWNWKTGAVMGRAFLGMTFARCAMALLTPTAVAIAMPAVITLTAGGLPRASRPCVSLWSFEQPPGANPDAPQPLGMHMDDNVTPRANLMTKLHFPDLQPGWIAYQLHMRPDPSFPAPQPGKTLGRRPFALDPQKGVIVLEMVLYDDSSSNLLDLEPPDENEQWEMFILRETLVAFAEAGEARRRREWASSALDAYTELCGGAREEEDALPRLREPTAIHIDWANWGEANARLKEPTMGWQRTWVCSCSGYRFASLRSDESLPSLNSAEGKVDLLVMDFNPTTARMRAAARDREKAPGIALAEPAGDDESCEMAMPPSPPPVFVDPVWPGDVPVPSPENEAGEFALGPAEVWVVDTPSTVESDAFGDVTTALPYTVMKRRVAGSPRGVMIEDQRVILASGWKTAPSRQEFTVWCM